MRDTTILIKTKDVTLDIMTAYFGDDATSIYFDVHGGKKQNILADLGWTNIELWKFIHSLPSFYLGKSFWKRIPYRTDNDSISSLPNVPARIAEIIGESRLLDSDTLTLLSNVFTDSAYAWYRLPICNKEDCLAFLNKWKGSIAFIDRIT